MFLLTNVNPIRAAGSCYHQTPCAVQMEAMEVDSPVELQGGGEEQPEGAAAEAAGPAEQAAAPILISDSGSSTEVDEDEDHDEGRTAARTLLRLPATWAFSQRVAGGAAAAPSRTPETPISRRLR